MTLKISKQKLTIFILGLIIISISGCGNNSASSVYETNSLENETSMGSSAEENTEIGFVEDTAYINKQLNYNYGNGTISVGTNKAPDNKHIYLNIKCSEAKDNNEIGYYIESSRNEIEIDKDTGQPYNLGDNAKDTNFIILNRLYNNVIPSTYHNKSEYGIRWKDDPMIDDTNDGTTITIRAVNLKTGEMIALCNVNILYENKEYRIGSITSGDVIANNELDAESRKNIISNAADFAAQRMHIKTSDFNIEGAYVDLHDGPYFGRFLGKDDTILEYRDYTTCNNTYAVTLPSKTYGYITVYYAPQTQLIGLTSATEAGSNDMHLKLYGYDPVYPYDEHVLLAPNGFLN